ncbi:serine/threonine-protein kinase [Ornithinimicrobium cryptoxanthini]|uniref:non-specific serine/threonine protein kinase n=1 Tax=Ornithinimicrobium cryptoxanthini TaxID=2934161 RepID=A0ABY4YIV1_9MICO|nr:serine/threonine-protein kinase [Ornithinimicrobium cryptoxanthini]USQ76263.1 serine/threonine protein kinase [Ornithinimicrobium cryptoxanthini]
MTGRLGRYRLEDVIGVGSFATVHRATDGWLEDTVALKVLAENHSLNPEVRERFIAEGRSLRRVKSPHVLTVHDIGESERQQPYLVLEHADRGTLADRVATLRREGWTASAADVLVTARGLAAAIEAVHDAQLVHRDLSPGNVLLTTAPGRWLVRDSALADDTAAGAAAGASVVRADERLVVADLGMCKDLALNSGLTVAAGTSGFRPPEQTGGPGIVDTRADIWALSALLAWLCEGADLPHELAAALRRGQATDPDARHPDVASWLADIEGALAPRPPQSSVTAATPPPRRPRGVLVMALVATLALGLLGGILAGRWWSGTPAETDLATVAIEGPTQVRVGEHTTFDAVVTGLDSWVWVLPSGRYVVDQASVSVSAVSTGTNEVVLRGKDAAGTELETAHEITVTD